MAKPVFFSIHNEPSARNFAVATPDDTKYLDFISRGVICGGAGHLAVTKIDGTTVTLPSFPAGTLLPICVMRVLETGTTATDILVLF